ncbi:MAG: response regulator transcription factor [Gammaproteobacteria bacterium]|nr:response regulator transcription factor [Gammaproteobacteria bacterium]
MTRSVLIIEDEPDIARLIQMHLNDIGCITDWVEDGKRGLLQFQQGSYDLLILDLMLPGMDGLSICREIRTGPGFVPILMLTAKSSELDRVLGLEMGADDYLAKPFSLPELIARVKALFRRVDAFAAIKHNDLENQVIEKSIFKIDLGRHLAWVDGKQVDLTVREFDLLLYFLRHPGRAFSRVQLLDQVWGYNHEGYEHTVNTHINRLRAKVEKNPKKPRYIQTVWGVGYKFVE